ncbi:DUF1190 domain-containing protein [soil metagenome]
MISESAPPRRMKRSAALALTTAMASAGLALTACDDGPDKAPKQPVEAIAYANIDECKTKNQVPDAECDTAFATALADNDAHAPRYEAQSSCEDVYGPGNCVPRGYNNGGGGGWFAPMLTGFVIGRMLDGGGHPYYRGTGLYRQYDGGYVTGYGGRLNRDYSTGRSTIDRSSIDPPDSVRHTPPKMQTRTSVVSRGGFGGGSRSYSGSRSSSHGSSHFGG